MKREEERREGEGIDVRSRGKSTKGAPDGVGGHTRAHGSYSRPIVEEECGATEGKGIVDGLLPKGFEEFDRLADGRRCEVSTETRHGCVPR